MIFDQARSNSGRIAAIDLITQTPSSVAPCLIACRSYNVRGTLIALVEMVAEMQFLEHVFIMFLNGLSPVNGSRVRQQKRVFRIERIFICLLFGFG